MYIFALTSVIIIFFIWIFVPLLYKRYLQYNLGKICKKRRLICLTFDDGPSLSLTRRIIDLLDANNVKATFFVLGGCAVALPNVMLDTVRSGHEIGSHSYRHLNAWFSNPFSVYLDLKSGISVANLYCSNGLFRPPYGKLSIFTLLQSLFHGLKLFFWTIDSSDTWEPPLPTEVIIESLKKNGGVVLMHDFARLDCVEVEDYVLELLSGIIIMARKEGYLIVTAGDLLNMSQRK